ncbi:hypothetical protein SAMN05421493_1327 [Pseudobutyrivibrio sp. 49]|nr:hypothetical protein SAMN05421493_1327 [Pseudobutyrivibrio sp. 49]
MNESKLYKELAVLTKDKNSWEAPEIFRVH